MITLYGIRNCSTMKKAFAWLDEQAIPYHFHDYKKSGVPDEALRHWVRQLGWRTLLNTQGTTWRKLTPEQQADLTQGKAMALMREYPSLIKRPVTDTGSQLIVGFDPALFDSFVRPAAQV